MRRTPTPFRAVAVTATLSALLLAGCGGDEPEVEQTPPAETTEESSTTDGPATTDGAPTTEAPEDDGATEEPTDAAEETAAPSGPVTAADGAFQITPPDGWLDVRDQVEQQVEIAVRDDEMTDDFFVNLVVASEEPIGDLADSIEAAAEQVAGADGDYEMLDPIEIDGTDAYGFVLTRTTGGVEVAQTQWWAEHNDRLYVTTFSTAKSQQEASQPIMEDLLSTWAWQD
ncbi:hypothetical protein [Ornithinimicrobium cavernae]|uniref:hypothetical protein n=1 Tax=Ornithinimicrobium cavernae TaxID=2666047 RepID=UPI000D68875B|nr:hypothetical protein [Ornithinimicrobium cavernae]